MPQNNPTSSSLSCCCWLKPSPPTGGLKYLHVEKRPGKGNYEESNFYDGQRLSYRAWLLSPQEALAEGIVGEYLGQTEGSVSHTGGPVDGGRKVQQLRLLSLVMNTMPEDMAEGIFTALVWPSCLRCATRPSWLTSLSSQGHLAPALLICRIRKRDWAQQLLQPWADPLSRPHMSIKDSMFGQEQVSLDKNSALLSLFTLWWNSPHAPKSGYDLREILAPFSPSLFWQLHWPHRELPVLLWDPALHLRCPTLTSAVHVGCVALSLLLPLSSAHHYSNSLCFFSCQTICPPTFLQSFG